MKTEWLPLTLALARKHWRNLAASFLHFALTNLCFLLILFEWFDQATGEDKVQISESSFLAASIGLKAG